MFNIFSTDMLIGSCVMCKLLLYVRWCENVARSAVLFPTVSSLVAIRDSKCVEI
jgi:hypothetical protein